MSDDRPANETPSDATADRGAAEVPGDEETGATAPGEEASAGKKGRAKEATDASTASAPREVADPREVAEPEETGDSDPDGEAMSKPTRLAIVVYLFIAIAISGYLLFELWRADPGTYGGPDVVELTGTAPADGSPEILGVRPARITLGEGLPNVVITGFNFDATSTVTLDGRSRDATLVDANHLSFDVVPGDFVQDTWAEVVVTNPTPPVQTSDPKPVLLLTGRNPTTVWTAFWWRSAIPLEGRLFLMVILVGGLGASVMALQSYSDYRGQRKLTQSWATHYFVKPPLGGGVAFVFYLVIRGGLMPGAQAETAATTPYGILAVSALVGMFSDKAIRKLREVFLTLFKSDDTLGETLDDGKKGATAAPPATQDEAAS